MAAHSSMLAWEIPWTEEPGGAWWAMVRGLQSFRHDCSWAGTCVLSWESHTPAPCRLRWYLILNSKPPCGVPHFSLSISHTYMRCASVFLFLICLSLQESQLRIQKDKKKMILPPLQHGHPTKYNAITKGEKALSFQYKESLWGVKSKVSNCVLVLE